MSELLQLLALTQLTEFLIPEVRFEEIVDIRLLTDLDF